jgi:hypothetical protein
VKTCRHAALLMVTLFWLTAPRFTLADGGGWTMPNLNPFSQKTKTTTPARAAKPPTSGWHMPSLWPAAPAGRTKPNQPSTLQKVTAGTKNIVSKTADALNPWDNKPQSTAPPKPSGSNSAFNQASAKKKQTQNTSVLPSWPWGAKEEDKPMDVNRFLSQPRPGY